MVIVDWDDGSRSAIHAELLRPLDEPEGWITDHCPPAGFPVWVREERFYGIALGSWLDGRWRVQSLVVGDRRRWSDDCEVSGWQPLVKPSNQAVHRHGTAIAWSALPEAPR